MTLPQKTRSICNKCFGVVDAEVFEKKGRVYIKKECPKHGIFVSPHVWDDPEIYNYLIKFDVLTFPSRKVLLNLTNRCNMNCHFCYSKANDCHLEELNLADIKKMDIDKFSYFFLSGGEPTIKKDIIPIIKYLKRKKKTVFLLTNGLRLIEKKFMSGLRKSKVDLVILQFDSLFKQEVQYLRGMDLLDKKIEIVNSLSANKVPTYLFSVQLRKNNYRNIKRLADFIIMHRGIIKGVNLNTIWKIGRYKDKDWLSTGEILKNCCKALKIKKKEFLITTEFIYYLFNCISWVTNRRRYFSRCLLFFMFIYHKGRIIPISRIFNLNQLIRLMRNSIRKKRKMMLLTALFYLVFYELFINFFKNKNFRVLIWKSLSNLRYIFRFNKFLFNPFTTINIGEFPTSEDLDFDFVNTCNLLFLDARTGQVVPVCINQIRYAGKA